MLAAVTRLSRVTAMEWLSILWRVRGSVPVPHEADDDGLLGRVADVFAQYGAEIAEERHDGIFFSRPRYFVPLPLDGGEVRREGMSGRRILRYDLPLLQQLPNVVLHGVVLGGIVGRMLVWLGAPPFAYASAGLAMLLLYEAGHRRSRASADEFLRRAFET
jgi:hypothetical protein